MAGIEESVWKSSEVLGNNERDTSALAAAENVSVVKWMDSQVVSAASTCFTAETYPVTRRSKHTERK